MNTKVPPLGYSPQQVIGKTFGLDPTALFNQENRGMFQLGGAMVHMQIHIQENERLLLLMADLGLLPVKKRNEYHQRMLVANSSWSDLAGGTLCMNDSGTRALLRLRLDLNALDSEALARWVKAFAVSAEEWAHQVASTDSPAATPAVVQAFTPPLQDFPGISPLNRA